MENIQQEWYPQVIKWQEVFHNKEYQGSKDDVHKYITIEHEAVILYDRLSGQTKLISHIPGKEKNNKDE